MRLFESSPRPTTQFKVHLVPYDASPSWSPAEVLGWLGAIVAPLSPPFPSEFCACTIVSLRLAADAVVQRRASKIVMQIVPSHNRPEPWPATCVLLCCYLSHEAASAMAYNTDYLLKQCLHSIGR